jgi:hypothetical protein
VFYLFNTIGSWIPSNDQQLSGCIRDVNGLKLDRIHNKTSGCLVGHPYIASLWLGSLALKRLCLKGVLRLSLALFCVLPSNYQASESQLTKGFKRTLCYFTRPFSCLNGVNAIQGILSCISRIPSK